MSSSDPADVRPSVSVFIPVYRSEQSIGLVLDRVRVAIQDNFRVTFVLVDDASPDRTWEVITAQAEEHGDIVAVRHSSNQGHNRALKTGLALCEGDWTVTIDDDLQHPPEDVPRLLNYAIEGGFDTVFGVAETRKHAAYKNLGSKIYLYFLSVVTGVPRSIRATAFRVMHRSVVERLASWQIGQPQASYMIFRITRNIGNLQVGHNERQYGQSGISLWKAIRLAVDSLIYFSTVPLKFAVGIAGLVFLSGLALASGYTYAYYAREITHPGFATTVILIIGFGSANLILTAIVGLYVARLMEESVGTVAPLIRDEIRRPRETRGNTRFPPHAEEGSKNVD